MKNTFLFISVLLVTNFISCGGKDDPTPTTGAITGKVTMAATGAAVEGANVYTIPASGAATSGSDGGYEIKSVTPGQHTVIAGKGDYNGSRMVVVIEGETRPADIPLNQNRLPNPPALVAPANNSLSQPVSLQLAWTCSDPDGDPLIYDVYADTLTPPQTLVISNQHQTQFLLQNLTARKTYFWNIVAKDNKGGIMSSPEWKFATALFTQTWSTPNKSSRASNPDGVWSYGRKWSPEGTGFDLFPAQWTNGWNGWYLGGGQWYPSMAYADNGVALWVSDNSNGLTCIRWTCPSTGSYNLTSAFTGIDTRGVTVRGYVVINTTVKFSDDITAYLDSIEYTMDSVYLQQGDHVDFLVKWSGGNDPVAHWTEITATIKKF